MKFNNNITVSGPADGFPNAVTILETGDNYTVLRICGRLTEQE
jgi:hypothetical protein